MLHWAREDNWGMIKNMYTTNVIISCDKHCSYHREAEAAESIHWLRDADFQEWLTKEYQALGRLKL